MLTPFVLSMAIQERATDGKYTKYHWRSQFKNYLKTKEGQKWYKQIKIKEDKQYIKQLLKEIQ